MASKAELTRILDAQVLEADDLRYIASTCDMRRPRAVAVFAAVAAFLDQCVMGCAGEVPCIDFCMAGLAGV
jgi:hypothetical protein